MVAKTFAFFTTSLFSRHHWRSWLDVPHKLQKGVDFDNLVGPQFQQRLRSAGKGKGDTAPWWDAEK